ncbi:MFS transporter [Alkalihalobacterium chitinilyticum]|uniref:MFS transporter n=1 Tax=Alkalihalobacterium chitinilyticum TaxID=2980103 RepID=A0ABT5VFZ8_9BACI|nr:MFS transporter [Alkalihalobacterium chitinilyticum]MDE5414385.1 MFS transporter [Alkalihalobacterium chitinilyticum]
MILIYIIIAVAFIDTFSQLPIIAPFAIELGANPLLVGIIIGMYSFSNMLGNLLSGVWIDRIGSKRILYVGMLTVGVIIFFYSMVSNAYELLVIRFFHGMAGGLIVPAAFTFLGSRGERAENGRTMAYSGAGVGIAAIAGPAIGAIVSGRFGYNLLFYFISSLMIVFGVLAAVFLREKSKLRTSAVKHNTLPKLKELVPAYLSIFLLMYTLGLLTYLLPLKVIDLNLFTELTGILLSVFGLVAILIFVFPTNRVFDQWNKPRLMKSGLIVISIALLYLAVAVTLSHMVISMVIYGIGFALIFPSASGTVIERTREKERGKAFGLFYAFFSLGVICGSFSAGVFSFIPAYQFVIGAMFVLFTLSTYTIVAMLWKR